MDCRSLASSHDQEAYTTMWALLSSIGGRGPHLPSDLPPWRISRSKAAARPRGMLCPRPARKCVVYVVNQLGPCSEWLPHPGSVPTTSKELVRSSQRRPLLSTKDEVSPWGSQRVFYNGTLGKPGHQTKLLRAPDWLRWTRAPVELMG